MPVTGAARAPWPGGLGELLGGGGGGGGCEPGVTVRHPVQLSTIGGEPGMVTETSRGPGLAGDEVVNCTCSRVDETTVAAPAVTPSLLIVTAGDPENPLPFSVTRVEVPGANV